MITEYKLRIMYIGEEYKNEPLRRCEWAEKKTETSIHLICPKWKKKGG